MITEIKTSHRNRKTFRHFENRRNYEPPLWGHWELAAFLNAGVETLSSGNGRELTVSEVNLCFFSDHLSEVKRAVTEEEIH